MKKALFVWCCVVLLVACEEKEPPCVPNEVSHIQIIAHRGVTYNAPENGLRAIALTIETGAHAVEFDVQLTKDNELVVFHDEDLYLRTGQPGKLKDFTLDELKSLRLKNKHGELTNEEIPTLHEVLDRVAGKVPCFIDLKISSLYMEKELVRLLERYNMVSSCTILSFDNKALQRIHRLNPSLAVCLSLYSELLPPIKGGELADYSHLKGFSLNYKISKTPILDNLKQNLRAEKIYIYTVNAFSDLPQENYPLVNGIITDDPEEWKLYTSACK